MRAGAKTLGNDGVVKKASDPAEARPSFLAALAAAR
jgi:hypothetical protein